MRTLTDRLGAALLRRAALECSDPAVAALLQRGHPFVDGGATLQPRVHPSLEPRRGETPEQWQARVGTIIVVGGSPSMYDKGRERFATAATSLTADTIKVALVLSTYSPNVATHEFLTDISSFIVGTDQTLTTKTATAGIFNADPATWSGGSAPASGATTIAYLVLYKSTGTAGSSPLIGYIDTATNLPLLPNGGSVSVSWSTGANKILKI